MRAHAICTMPHRAQRRGVATVELAMLLPLIMTLLLGVWEVGRAVDVQQIMSNAAREGGRQASTGQLNNAQIQQVVTDYLSNAQISTAHVVVTVQNLTTPGVDAIDGAQLDRFKITVTMPFKDVAWAALNHFFPATSTITAEATWCSVKDKEYPSATGAPPGD